MVQMSTRGAKPRFSAPRRLMPRRPDPAEFFKHLLWVCMILAVAAYDAVIVQNVTETLMGITYQPASVEVIQRPGR